MRLGYFAMPLHAPERPAAEWLEEDLHHIEVLDRLGYAEAWIGEHNANPWEAITSPEIFIAAALQRSHQIRLGTGVSVLPHHHPVQIANRIALLDHLSRGRINWGIGISGHDESEVFDIDWRDNEHRRLFRDVLECVLDLWSDPEPGPRMYPRINYRVIDPAPPLRGLHMRPYQRPHPPIGVAGVSPTSESLLLAGQNGWIPMSISLLSTTALRRNWETYEQGAVTGRRTPDRDAWRIAREVFIGETPAKAREQALRGPIARSWREFLLPTNRRFGAQLQALTGPGVDLGWDDLDALLEHFCEHLWIVGDVDEVVDKLNGLYDDVGGFGTLLVIAQDWEESLWERSMTRLRRDVLPRVRGLGARVLA